MLSPHQPSPQTVPPAHHPDPPTCRDLVTAICGRMRSVSSVITPRRPTDTPRAWNRWGLEVGVTVRAVPVAVMSVREVTCRSAVRWGRCASCLLGLKSGAVARSKCWLPRSHPSLPTTAPTPNVSHL